MKKVNFEIRVNRLGENGTDTVSGQVFYIGENRFGVVKSSNGYWSITELSTGMKVSQEGCKTMSAAIEALYPLLKANKAVFDRLLSENLAKYGELNKDIIPNTKYLFAK